MTTEIKSFLSWLAAGFRLFARCVDLNVDVEGLSGGRGENASSGVKLVGLLRRVDRADAPEVGDAGS